MRAPRHADVVRARLHPVRSRPSTWDSTPARMRLLRVWRDQAVGFLVTDPRAVLLVIAAFLVAVLAGAGAMTALLLATLPVVLAGLGQALGMGLRARRTPYLGVGARLVGDVDVLVERARHASVLADADAEARVVLTMLLALRAELVGVLVETRPERVDEACLDAPATAVTELEALAASRCGRREAREAEAARARLTQRLAGPQADLLDLSQSLRDARDAESRGQEELEHLLAVRPEGVTSRDLDHVAGPAVPAAPPVPPIPA